MSACPKCRRQYEFGIYYCEPCQLSLIPAPRGAVSQIHRDADRSHTVKNILEMRVVFDVDKQKTSELLVIKSLIESAGIDCHFLSSDGRLLNVDSCLDPERSGDLKMVQALVVPESDYADAKALLDWVLENERDEVE
jgi:hypothetical protein